MVHWKSSALISGSDGIDFPDGLRGGGRGDREIYFNFF